MTRKLTLVQVDLERCRCGIGAHGYENGPAAFITMPRDEDNQPVLDDEAVRQLKTMFPSYE